jgi:hypothetical protein
MIIMVKSLWHFTKLFVFERQKKTVAHLTRVTLFEQVEAVALIRPPHLSNVPSTNYLLWGSYRVNSVLLPEGGIL